MVLNDIAVSYKDAVIPDGTGKKTPAIELEYSQSLVGIFHPAIDTSTAFTFEASKDGTTYVVMENGTDGNAYSLAINNAAAGYVPIIGHQLLFAGFRFLKIAVANDQTGAKTLTLAIRPIL